MCQIYFLIKFKVTKIIYYPLLQNKQITMNSIKKFISGFDLFPSLPTLRAKSEAEVTNFCGGIFSLIIFGIFVYVFVDSIIKTIKLEKIDAKQILQMNRPNSQHIGNITMSFGLQWNSLIYNRKYFQLRAFIANPANMQFIELQVFPCTRQYWNALSDQQYKDLNLAHSMCIQRDNVQVYGQNGQMDMRLLFFNLSVCDNATSPIPCATVAETTTFFATQMVYGRFMACSLVILDTALNPTNENPVSYTVYEKTQWLLFNQRQQILAQIFLGTYEVTTDTNFLPFVTEEYTNGYFVSETTITSLVNHNSHPSYIDIYLFASPINKVIDRKYGKIDETLSYVGGLFGIVLSFLAFFLMSFNQYKYQLRVSEGAFAFQNSYLAKQKDFHFGKYLKYVAYDWSKSFLKFEPNWQDCKAIDRARQQSCQQIDVKHLLQRISHLEQVIKLCVDPQKQTALYLAQLGSIEDVQRRRNYFEYVNNFSKGTHSITIQTLSQIDRLFNYANKMQVIDSSLVSNSYNQLGKGTDQSFQINNFSSLQLMDYYMNKYSQQYNVQDLNKQVNQQDQQIQQDLSKAFFRIEESLRKQIIKKIPIGVLIRLNKHNKQEKSKQANNYTSIVTEKQTTVLKPIRTTKLHQKKYNSTKKEKEDPISLKFN